MGGEDLDGVGQGQDLLLDGPAEGRRRRLRLGPAPEEIRPGQVAHEEGPAGQQQGGLVGRGGAIVHEQADVLRRVPGRVQDLDAHLTQLELLAVGEGAVVVAELGLGRAEQLDVAPGGDLGEAGQVVVVPVGVEGVGDAQALRPRHLEVLVDQSLRIEDQALARLLRSDEVRRVPETREVELPEEHHRPPRTDQLPSWGSPVVMQPLGNGAAIVRDHDRRFRCSTYGGTVVQGARPFRPRRPRRSTSRSAA